MANQAEEKLAASATVSDPASHVKADVEPKIAYRVEDKFAASATDGASENKDDVVPQAADVEPDGETASVHIVHLIRPEGEEPEVFDIRTLASVIGSEAWAKEAVVYHYTHAASGFAARLTPKQVAHLSEMQHDREFGEVVTNDDDPNLHSTVGEKVQGEVLRHSIATMMWEARELERSQRE